MALCVTLMHAPGENAQSSSRTWLLECRGFAIVILRKRAIAHYSIQKGQDVLGRANRKQKYMNMHQARSLESTSGIFNDQPVIILVHVDCISFVVSQLHFRLVIVVNHRVSGKEVSPLNTTYLEVSLLLGPRKIGRPSRSPPGDHRRIGVGK